jgi:AcrR family transcriptional regulator
MISPSTRRSADKPSAEPPLSRDAVVDRGLAIADAEGLSGVSIRRIAQDFGVTPMALYWHVKNKDELLAAMGDRILEVIDIPAEATAVGAGGLRRLLSALIDALRQHPGCTALAQLRILQCDTGRQLAEQALRILRDFGFSVQQSSNLARAALQTALVLVADRPGAETTVPAEERDAVLAGKRDSLKSLPVDRFPNLVECAESLTECPDETEYYAEGVELYLAGVKALARRYPVTMG